ncbi:hypothetical protein EVAR_58730_1 [Eumeta japonica]|uniref:Uncharacterized protein n=1 Tax=Eumeta variegata TaxID=151549 RepID=A0A4C1YVX2_EUMVA|nr:hypothetical protein EVAR_58730_1 [Eumeta japonica]
MAERGRALNRLRPGRLLAKIRKIDFPAAKQPKRMFRKVTLQGMLATMTSPIIFALLHYGCYCSRRRENVKIKVNLLWQSHAVVNLATTRKWVCSSGISHNTDSAVLFHPVIENSGGLHPVLCCSLPSPSAYTSLPSYPIPIQNAGNA